MQSLMNKIESIKFAKLTKLAIYYLYIKAYS